MGDTAGLLCSTILFYCGGNAGQYRGDAWFGTLGGTVSDFDILYLYIADHMAVYYIPLASDYDCAADRLSGDLGLQRGRSQLAFADNIAENHTGGFAFTQGEWLKWLK